MVEFVNNFVKDGFTGLIAVDFDKKVEGVVMLENGDGFLVELFEAGFKSSEIFVVFALATVVKDFGFGEAFFDIGFRDVKNDGGFDFVASSGGNRHDLSFFTGPAANRRQN